MILTDETRGTWRNPCPSATLPTTDLIRTRQIANPGLRGERLASNRLCYGMALSIGLPLNQDTNTCLLCRCYFLWNSELLIWEIRTCVQD
jgi:hypothetical protein